MSKSGKYTRILYLVDSSKCMASVRESVVGSLNNFIITQRLETGEVFIEIFGYNNKLYPLYSTTYQKELDYIPDKSFVPTSNPHILDSIGASIDKLGLELEHTKPENRPDTVCVIIQTAGKEIGSHKYFTKTIREKIKHQIDKYNWKFIYLGTDVGTMFNAKQIGIPTDNAAVYHKTPQGIAICTMSVSNAIKHLRNNNKQNMEWAIYNQNEIYENTRGVAA